MVEHGNRGGGVSRRSVGRRPRAAPVATDGERQVTRHAARARRARGMLRGGARRALALRPAQRHPATRAPVHGRAYAPHLEAS